MLDLTDMLLVRLNDHRLPGLNLGEGSIHPEYEGQSILNLPASICRLFGIPEFGAAPLIPEILSPLEGVREIRRVILVLIDALPFNQLQRRLASKSLPSLEPYVKEGLFVPLTSIAPSTTSAALTSFWTGLSAAAHAIAGYELWLKEYGIVANMILHSPMSFKGDTGSLEKAGFNPKTFLNAPTLGTHLLKNGIETYVFQPTFIADSGLSQMLFGDVTLNLFRTTADLFVNLRQLIDNRSKERMVCWVYWAEIDHLSHLYGPSDERPAAEFDNFSQAFERLLLSALNPKMRGDNLFILTSDHGQVTTHPDPHYDLRNHPSLTRRLHILPTGENRFIYLYIRPGQTEAVREYIERTWPGQFVILDPAYAIQAGLFGPGKPHPRLQDRLGDLLLLARGTAYLWWAEKENILIGRHGGLSPEEMLVPFLAFHA